MIGYEYEFLVREGDTPLTKATFLKFHKELKRRGWKQKFDPDTKGMLGSYKDGIVITMDDSVNNMEIEMSPTDTIHESHERLSGLLNELQTIYKRLGASVVGLGVFPGPSDFDHTDCAEHCTASRISPKSFLYYVVPKRWREHHWTQLFSGIHFWLDLPQEEITRQLSLFNRLNPFFVALFANGSVFDQKELGVLEGRNVLWMRQLNSSVIPYDSRIYGMYEEEYKNVLNYLNFILNDPLYFGTRDGVSFSLKDKAVTIREFLFSDGMTAVWGHGGEFVANPTVDDFFELTHATFPHARLKFFLRDGVTLAEILTALKKKDETALFACFRKCCFEIRTASAQTKGELSSPPALFLGLQNNLEKAEALVSNYPYDFLVRLYNEAEKKGLETKLDGMNIAETCKELISIAEEGLKQRGFGEEKYLEPLTFRVAKKENPAQELLKIWRKDGLAGVWKARDF